MPDVKKILLAFLLGMSFGLLLIAIFSSSAVWSGESSQQFVSRVGSHLG